VPPGQAHNCAQYRAVIQQQQAQNPANIAQQQADDIARIRKVADDIHWLYIKLPLVCTVIIGAFCLLWLILVLTGNMPPSPGPLD